MIPANFDYIAAKSLDEALSLLAKHKDDAKLLAGGHSLLPASPTPFTPIGFTGEGVTVLSISNQGIIAAFGTA